MANKGGAEKKKEPKKARMEEWEGDDEERDDEPLFDEVRARRQPWRQSPHFFSRANLFARARPRPTCLRFWRAERCERSRCGRGPP
jgi:hypothetical protein